MLLTEAAHTFGLCLFVFRVLPQFDVVRALLLMCSTCTLPALLKLLLTKGNRSIASIVVDIIALLMQASVFFLMTRYSTRDRSVVDNAVDLMQIAASLVLISVRYWENFVDRDIGAINIQSFKINLRLGRCKTYIFASLWKIGLTLAFAYILVPNMTPMGDLFNHLTNETAYDNKSLKGAVDSDTPAYYLPPPYEGGDVALYGDVDGDIDDLGLAAPRFRRQADEEEGFDEDNEEDLTTFGDTEELVILDDDPILNDDPIENDETGGGGGGGRGRNRDGGEERGGGRRRGGRRRKPQRPKVAVEDYDYEYEYSNGGGGLSSNFENFKKQNKVFFRFLPLIVQSLSGALCYYFARVACKLCMQGFSFSLPLTIISPLTASLFCYICYLQKWTRVYIPDMDIGYLHCTESYKITSFHWQIGCALALWWISQLWINNHIWFPKSERLAKVER